MCDAKKIYTERLLALLNNMMPKRYQIIEINVLYRLIESVIHLRVFLKIKNIVLNLQTNLKRQNKNNCCGI